MITLIHLAYLWSNAVQYTISLFHAGQLQPSAWICTEICMSWSMLKWHGPRDMKLRLGEKRNACICTHVDGYHTSVGCLSMIYDSQHCSTVLVDVVNIKMIKGCEDALQLVMEFQAGVYPRKWLCSSAGCCGHHFPGVVTPLS